MFALVEDGKITQMPKGNKGITLGDNQYPASIYTLWTEAERNAIGIYTVEIDKTNLNSENSFITIGNKFNNISNTRTNQTTRYRGTSSSGGGY